MAGKSDEDRAGRCAAWLDSIFEALSGEVDRTVTAIATSAQKLDDDAAVDRRARTITNIARAAKAVGALCVRPPSRSAEPASGGAPEDQMSKEDIDDIDADELEGLRAELQSRLDHLRAVFERKRVEGQPLGAPAASGDPRRAASAWPSISAVG